MSWDLYSWGAGGSGCAALGQMTIPGQTQCGQRGGKATLQTWLFLQQNYFFFFPNRILPETINVPEASLRGETDGAEELRVLRAYLPHPSENPEQTFRASSKNQHVFSLPTQALPPTHLLLPQHIPPESQGALLPLQGLWISWVVGGGA